MNPAKLYPQPHPVLTGYGDDFPESSFDFRTGEITAGNKEWQIPINECGTDLDDLNTLLRSGAASFFVHVECPETLWRRLFPIVDLPFTLEIPLDEVHGKVTFFPCMISTADIATYSPGGMHPDFGKTSFRLKAGDFLALGYQHEFEARLDYDPLETVGGILEVQKHDDPLIDLHHICLEADRIILTLPVGDYGIYTAARQNPHVSSLLLAGIIQPAILHAMNDLRSRSGEELEEVRELLWAGSILHKLEQLQPDWDESPEKLFQACQRLLKKPAEGALRELKNIIENS